MYQNPSKYENCVYYPFGTVTGQAFRYATALFAGKFCIPNSEEMALGAFDEFKKQFDNIFGGLNLGAYIADIAAAKEPLLYAIASAFLIGFVYMIVLRLCGGPIVYASLFFMVMGTAYGGLMLYQNSQTISEADKNKKYYLYGSYAVWGLAAALIFCICCNIKNIRIGVAVMKCTAQFIGSNP